MKFLIHQAPSSFSEKHNNPFIPDLSKKFLVEDVNNLKTNMYVVSSPSIESFDGGSPSQIFTIAELQTCSYYMLYE